jgi:hypothetical protein
MAATLHGTLAITSRPFPSTSGAATTLDAAYKTRSRR